MSAVSGFKARFAVKGGAAPRDMSTGSSFWPCLSDGIKKTGTILRPAGITGGRAQRQELVRGGAYTVGGPVVIEPSFAIWDEWLPRILGATESTDEFLPADTLPEFDWMSDRVGRIVRYNDCKVNRMELRFAPGLLVCTLDIMGITAVESGNTFPSVVMGVTDAYAPMAFHHAVFNIEGEPRIVREGTLVIDNQLDPRPKAGSVEIDTLREGERLVPLAGGAAGSPAARPASADSDNCLRPKCTSISVSSIRSKADFIIVRSNPFKSSIVRPGCYGSLRFRFRRLTPEEGMAVMADAEDMTKSERAQLDFATVGRHLLGWDLTDEAGNKVPVSEQALRKLENYYQWLRLMGIVKGYEAGDEDPQSGQKVETAGDDEKNSAAG